MRPMSDPGSSAILDMVAASPFGEELRRRAAVYVYAFGIEPSDRIMCAWVDELASLLRDRLDEEEEHTCEHCRQCCERCKDLA